MGVYMQELLRAMNFLGEQSDTIFLGQSVEVEGTAMRNTLVEIDPSKLLELPVEEDFQMGLSIGMSFKGLVPISIYPRWNFLLLATNQLVNHLDKLKQMTQSQNSGKVIIRTGIGSVHPLNPGPQHTGDFTDAFKLMCPNVNVVRLDSHEQIYPAYVDAYQRKDGVSTLLVEWSDKYNE